MMTAATLVLVLVLAPMPAAADQGVQVVPEGIDLQQPLTAGTQNRLPDITVTNPGSVLTAYQMAANPIRGSEQSFGQGWFAFSPQHFSLQPRKSRAVAVRLKLPATAAAGRYDGILRSEIVVDQAGAHVSAAAGSRVTFRVAAAPVAPDLWTGVLVGFQQHLPWSAAGSALLVIFVAGLLLSRRYKIRLERH